MKPAHVAETILLRGVTAGLGAMPWRRAIGAGALLGSAIGALGLRGKVARENLARAFPERPVAEREALLAENYRELGRVAAEYPHMPGIVRSAEGEVVLPVQGLAHLEAAAALGRGVILMTGHFGNFELLGAWLTRWNPVDFVVKPLSNPGAETWLADIRARSGVGNISTGGGVKRVFQALRQKRWVAMLADQDARRHGVFVPYFGIPSSTPEGPARIALASGAPIVFGWVVRQGDGRHQLTIEPPLLSRGDPRDEAAVIALTAQHTALLEAAVRHAPQAWFWLHRRWKTAPPSAVAKEE
ncbi:MAG: lysophospholipid acyltransferase family protein [Candidatus Eisenbacteria bacterium]